MVTRIRAALLLALGGRGRVRGRLRGLGVRLGAIERQLGVIGQTATPPVGSQNQRS